MPKPGLEWLRARAVARSLFTPTTLAAAIERLAFVQADPIRSPARAQDLILRHRVLAYRAGDLERLYPSLDIEEDYLYAYGFLPRPVWRLLHPRRTSPLSPLESRVLDVVRRLREAHPRDLDARLGGRRVVNAWGGRSKATTRALDDLQYRGLLRVVRRESGIRVYGAAAPIGEPVPTGQRLRRLILTVVGLLAPVPERTLHATIARFRRLGPPRAAFGDLVRDGDLRTETIDGVSYVWPTRDGDPEPVPRIVRFLAPFDPLVWDRRRFEHLWGWPYRFEAYTPAAKRVRGYYAMPLLWGSRAIGWANARMRDGRLDVELGFVGRRPVGTEFRRELEAEIARLDTFLRGESR
ncbi:MAG: crosslink repair DNA glycosylase YcaQ family protein [Planctomycetota bacterium]